MKNLIFITDNYPFGKGETFIENEIEYLAKSFRKIYIFSLNKTDIQTRMVPANCEVFRVDLDKNKKKYLLKATPLLKDKLYFKDYLKNGFQKRARNFLLNSKIVEEKVLEIIEKKGLRADELIGYSYWFHFSAYAIGSLKEKGFLSRAISRAHRYDLFIESGDQVLKDEILEKIDKVYSVSHIGENYLKALYKSNKISTSYLGTRNIVSNFKNYKNSSEILILSCSNLIPVKRVKLIVEALSNLDNMDKSIKWIHFGDGKERENIEKLSLKKLKNISWELKGAVPNCEILKFYKENNVKVFISTSLSEGLPVSMMEAQSFGIPIIATDAGGVKEIVNEDTGILLQNNPKIEDIVNAIEKILNMSLENYTELRKNCYDNWYNNFRAEKNYKNFILEELLK